MTFTYTQVWKYSLILAIITVIVLIILCNRYNNKNNCGCYVNTKPCPPGQSIPCDKSNKESYGPPPGMSRSIDSHELPYLYGDRGWAHFPKEYEGNSASSISHMIERSA